MFSGTDAQNRTLNGTDGQNQISSGIYAFFNTKITCVPIAVINIAKCTVGLWLCILWIHLHAYLLRYLHVILSKGNYPAYKRFRVLDAAWYLAFHGTALVYCWSTLRQNDVELFYFKKMPIASTQTSLSYQVLISYALIHGCYIVSNFWDKSRIISPYKLAQHLCLFGIGVSSSYLRVEEMVYVLVGMENLSNVAFDMTKILYTIGNKDSRSFNIFVTTLFVASIGIFTTLHAVVIPLTIVVPLGKKMFSDYSHSFMKNLYTCLLGWLIMALYNSVLFNVFKHWLFHNREVTKGCPNNLIECCIFEKSEERNQLQILRQEAKNRKQEMILKRKIKNRGMLLQTLKCMVALKRKLSEKRRDDTTHSVCEKSHERVLIEKDSDHSQNENEDINKFRKEECDIKRSKDKTNETWEKKTPNENFVGFIIPAEIKLPNHKPFSNGGKLKSTTVESNNISPNGNQTKNLTKEPEIQIVVGKTTNYTSASESNDIINDNRTEVLTEIESGGDKNTKASFESKRNIEKTPGDSLLLLKNMESDEKIVDEKDANDNETKLKTEKFILTEKLNDDNKPSPKLGKKLLNSI